VLNYLNKIDPECAQIARERYGCLTPWRSDPVRYGRMALSRGYALCEKPVADALFDLLKKRLDYLTKGGEDFFSAEQNARIVAAAEQYYRAMYYGDAVSWNLRDQHMFDTLERLLAHRGPRSKAVVWAHNSHIGNAEFTEMGQVRGEHNIGQLAHNRFDDKAALIVAPIAARSPQRLNGTAQWRLSACGQRATIPMREAVVMRASPPSSSKPGLAKRNISAMPWPSRCSSGRSG
jgi:erythromycin esterase-like protein